MSMTSLYCAVLDLGVIFDATSRLCWRCFSRYANVCAGALGFYTFHVLLYAKRNLTYLFAAALVLQFLSPTHTERSFHCTGRKRKDVHVM